MGWARANILYEKARRLPQPGGPMEILFILVWKMRQTIEFQKSRVMAQCFLAQKGADDETIKKVFDELKEAFFPFDLGHQKQDKDAMRKYLMAEIQRGPLVITRTEELTSPKIRSRLERGRREMAKKLSMEQSGKIVEMDAFDRAHRRPRGVF